MVAGQLGVSLDEAFVRLRADAFDQESQLRTVAGDIVARRPRLTSVEWPGTGRCAMMVPSAGPTTGES